MRPERHTDRGGKGPAAVGQPCVWVHAELIETKIQEALTLQNPFPDQSDHDWRQQHGKEEYGAPE
ncbi:hypothetical protein D3C87_1946200 [compost metagenome]